MGKLADAERVLRLEGLELTPDAETHRIRALAEVVKKDLFQAQREAMQTLALKPGWVNTRFSAAVVDYLSGLSPAVIEFTPSPVQADSPFMKRDDASMRHAGAVFKDLAEEAQGRPAERQNYEAWYLACLGHDPERRQEAIAYCELLLTASPRHYQAIRWAIANGHKNDIPLESSREPLSRLVEEGKANVAEIVALIGCYLAGGDEDAAVRLTEETQTIFESAGAVEWWQFWRLRLMVVTGQTGPALIEINQSTPTFHLRQARVDVVQELARKSGRWQPLSVVLDDNYRGTRDPIFLLESCQLQAKLNNWGYIADHAQTLIDTLDTADAVRLAVTGTYRAGRYLLCIGLLEGKEGYFPKGRFPGELSKLKAACYQALGRMTDAVAETERLSGSDPSTENLIRLANLYTLSFDLDQAVSVARRLEDKDDLSAPQLLHLEAV